MKKIAFIHQVFLLGGAERVTCDIVRELTKTDKYEFFVFTQEYIPENIPADLLANEQLHIVEIPCLGVDSENKKKYDWAFVINQIKHYEIDVVVSVVYSYRMLLSELKQMGCKTIFAHHSMPFWETIPKHKKARERSSRSIGKRLEYWFLKYPRYELLHTIDKPVYKKYLADLQSYDAFTVLCEGYKNDIINTLHLDDTLKNKIHVIPNMQKPADEVCYDKQKEFLFVGRLSYADKRVDRLIEAWRIAEQHLPDWRLTIVGDGPELPRLKQRADGLHGVSFEGYQNPEPYYKRASALCLVSEFEGFPLCLVEAQAQGVVPIAMNCTEGVATIINPNGINGMLVKKGNTEAFAQKMLEFAALSDDERLRLRHNVVNKSLEYSPQRVAAEWDKVLA